MASDGEWLRTGLDSNPAIQVPGTDSSVDYCSGPFPVFVPLLLMMLSTEDAVRNPGDAVRKIQSGTDRITVMKSCGQERNASTVCNRGIKGAVTRPTVECVVQWIWHQEP